jgi:signal transduction histidine kinase
VAKEELLSSHPGYNVSIDYETIPDDENETVIQGNEELLKRVFSNLLDNACKYSPDHSAQILISSDSKSCTVKVRDQGIGISPEDIPHIFNPFFRSTNATELPGFGIGLSICQRIVELHHGSISVTSEMGKGSEFQVHLNHI